MPPQYDGDDQVDYNELTISDKDSFSEQPELSCLPELAYLLSALENTSKSEFCTIETAGSESSTQQFTSKRGIQLEECNASLKRPFTQAIKVSGSKRNRCAVGLETINSSQNMQNANHNHFFTTDGE